MENDQVRNPRIFLTWTSLFFIVMIAIWFLHEAAHGFGFKLEGIPVSTGFNLVGESGKAPNDPNFSNDLPIKAFSLGIILGPLTTWVLTIVFTAILLRRTQSNRSSLLIGVVAVTNALMRLVPVLIFFIALTLGNTSGVWQDEQNMSLGLVEGIELPISESELSKLVDSDPSIFLGDPSFYLWPLVSFGISLVCLILSYRQLFKLFHAQLQARWKRIAFGAMPFILYFLVFGVVSFLDTFIRINW